MTIDIFQYSNVYTLRRSIQWLADEATVKEECGPYVTKPGFIISSLIMLFWLIHLQGRHVPHWPRLLHWYSRFKHGKTVFEWMEENNESDAIDVRRFTSFGIIKVSCLSVCLNLYPEATNDPHLGVSASSAQMAYTCFHRPRAQRYQFSRSKAR
jgi:hypothetical protein